MDTVVAIIQARMNSTRLPKKVMADIQGNPLLWHICHRLRHSQRTQQCVIATTENSHDDLIAHWCKKERIACFRGAEKDVLDRFYQAAKKYSARYVVRITADCPLVDPALVDQVVALCKRSHADYASNTQPATFPDGLDVEVVSFDALERCWNQARHAYQREHVTSYITENPDLFSLENVWTEPDHSQWRLTVDEPEDLDVVRLIYQELYNPQGVFGYEEIARFIAAHPELLEMNDKYLRNETYNTEDK
jgi:spore coat polysaccharide biosynthesis protein SpsF